MNCTQIACLSPIFNFSIFQNLYSKCEVDLLFCCSIRRFKVSCSSYLTGHLTYPNLTKFSKERNLKEKMNFERTLFEQTTYPDIKYNVSAFRKTSKQKKFSKNSAQVVKSRFNYFLGDSRSRERLHLCGQLFGHRSRFCRNRRSVLHQNAFSSQ